MNLKSVHELLMEHRESLRAFAQKLTRKSDNESEDLLHDACVRILSRSHQYRTGTKFKSWAFRIMQTIWIDQCRRVGNRAEQPIDAHLLDFYYGSERSVREAEARMLCGQALRKIQELPAEQRTVLVLVIIHNQSYKQVAATMGTPIGSVMSRLARARDRLACELDGTRKRRAA